MPWAQAYVCTSPRKNMSKQQQHHHAVTRRREKNDADAWQCCRGEDERNCCFSTEVANIERITATSQYAHCSIWEEILLLKLAFEQRDVNAFANRCNSFQQGKVVTQAFLKFVPPVYEKLQKTKRIRIFIHNQEVYRTSTTHFTCAH